MNIAVNLTVAEKFWIYLNYSVEFLDYVCNVAREILEYSAIAVVDW